MISKPVTILACFFCVLLAPSALAREVQLKWNEIATLTVGHDVQLQLPDGATVSGEALAVRQDSFEMNVRQASRPALYPKGQVSIPRASVSVIEVRKERGIGGRVVGTVLGMVAGMIVGGEVAGHSGMSEGPALGTFFASTAGITTIGYAAGSALDHHVTLIRIVP